jgi:hypothetical protein
VECETPHYCNGADRANISAAAAAAANADTVLLFIGMNSNGNNGTGAEFGGQGSSETEAKDRYDIKLRGVQQELLEVWKTPLLGAFFVIKRSNLPRQARDKHGEVQRNGGFSQAVVAANPQVVVVLMNAGCLALNASLVPAVLSVYYPG